MLGSSTVSSKAWDLSFLSEIWKWGVGQRDVGKERGTGREAPTITAVLSLIHRIGQLGEPLEVTQLVFLKQEMEKLKHSDVKDSAKAAQVTGG